MTDDARDALAEALRHAECHEDVTRRGESQPCGKTAVAVRIDPTEGDPYPVCAYHARADMVPLAPLIFEAEERGRADNERHDMCYVSGSKALAALLADAKAEERKRIAAVIQRDHGVPFGSNANRSWPYRDGYFDGAMHAACIARAVPATAEPVDPLREALSREWDR